MTANVFDQAARYSVQSDPPGFLRWVVPGLPEALRFRGWLDTRTLPFPGTPDRTCDTVAELAEDDSETGRRWAIVSEFQTEPEPEMLDRLLEYLARLRRGLRFGPQRREKYQVVAALVNLTGPAPPEDLEMALPGLASPSLRFHPATRTLRSEDAAATLDGIAAGETSRCMLCWISLMRGGGEPAIIERWKGVAVEEPESVLRATYGAIVTLFAELTDCVPRWQSGLEGWNMRESTVVAEWKAEGKAEGRAEGRAEGIAEGIAEGKRSALLLVLRQKFGATIPADLGAAIEAQADVDILSRWLAGAVAAESLDAFRAAIGR